MNRKLYTKEEIETFKTDIIEYQAFKYMDCSQQAELLLHYEKQFSPKELAELWGIKSSAIHSLKHKLKKSEYIKEENGSKTNKANKKVKEKIVAIQPDEVLPEAYETQIIDYPSEVQDETVKVSLDEFMKMLEIQEKMAKMMEVQARNNQDGFNFRFNGEFTVEQLTRKLNKVLAMIDDEPYKYQVKFELVELEQTEETTETHNELLEEVNSLQESMKEMQKQLEDQKENKVDWKAGYQTFKTDIKGLHHARSEYEKSGSFTGIAHINGKTLYQTFYICPECNHKGKHYLENGTIYCKCGDCGKRMRIRDAVKEDHLTKDSFGNFFIAGKFKREDEVEVLKG